MLPLSDCTWYAASLNSPAITSQGAQECYANVQETPAAAWLWAVLSSTVPQQQRL